MSSTLEQQQKAPQDLLNVVKFLRSSKSGMKIRVGALGGKRMDYFKGKSAIKALLSPAYSKASNVPPVTSEEDATAVLSRILPFAFFIVVERGASSTSSGASHSARILTVPSMQPPKFDSAAYYVWLYSGPQWTTYAGGAAMVALLLAGVMFPLWPPIMRLGVWYLSMGMLGLIGLFFALAIVRLIFYVITIVVVPPGIWIFPQLFADVGFVESFIPLWEWDIPQKKKRSKKHREGSPSSKSSKSKGKGKEKSADSSAVQNGADAAIDSVSPASGSVSPAPRGVTIEDVPEDHN